MISKKFIKSSFIYTMAGALPMASAIILLPFYIEYLPTEVYGALSLYLAFSLFVQVLVTYSFDSSTYIHYHEYKGDPAKLSSFISSVFIFMLLTGAGVGLVLVIAGDILFDLIFDDQKISFFPYGILAVVTGIFQALFKVYSNLLQSREKPVLFLRSNLLLFGLIAGLTVSGLYMFPGTLVGPVGGRMIAGLVVAAWALYRIFSEFGIQFNFQLLKSTFDFNHYTFIYQIQMWVINYFDRFVMLFFLPLSSVGIYDFAIKCLVVVEFIMNGLYATFYPKVVSTIAAQTAKGSTVEMNRYFHGLTAIVMFMVSFGILLLPVIVNELDNQKGYHEAIQYFPYIAIIYLVKGMRLYFASPYTVLKFTKPLPVIYTIISIVKIGGMLILVRPYGIYGVIAATLFSSVIDIVALRYVVRQKFTFQYNFLKIAVAPLVLLIAVLLFEPILGSEYMHVLHGAYVFMAGGFLLWVYRNELKLIDLTKIIRS